ncbi:hypothetical protein GCM10022226_42610 [Sphaerisporangium flaviroseum]|uniref:Transposase n=1 Tax=Sphaerisporangium flaviroseum TaxID=509199 RepID=A0ABP7IG60_9ACTN
MLTEISAKCETFRALWTDHDVQERVVGVKWYRHRTVALQDGRVWSARRHA